MAPSIPSREPTRAVAGTTWTWSHSSSVYPASEGWVLSYAITGPSALGWDPAWVTTSPEGTHLITIPSAATSGLQAGQYRLVRYWSRSTERYAEPLDPLLVEADAAAAAGGTLASPDEEALAAVTRAIAARLAGDEPEEYSIGSYNVRRMSLDTLRAYQQQLRAAVWSARTGRAGPSSYVVFTRPA